MALDLYGLSGQQRALYPLPPPHPALYSTCERKF